MSIVDARGREVRRATIEHNAAGLRELLELLSRAGAREVAIERPDGPVVDTLLEAGITVVVISPNQLKNLRGRYGSAGNKDDRFDAFVLADTLRTDRSRLRPLLPDTPATATLRRTCRPRKDLVAHRVALANQLRAHLRVVFPGVVGLFADLDSPISLAFLTFLPRFDCQDRADWLSVKRLAGWLAAAGYCGRAPRPAHRCPARRHRLWGHPGFARPPHPTLAGRWGHRAGQPGAGVPVSPPGTPSGPDHHYRTGRQPHRRRQRGPTFERGIVGAGVDEAAAGGSAVAWAHRRARRLVVV